MYLILFIIGVILNILLAIRGKNIDIKEMILGTIIFFCSSFNNYFWNIIFNTIEFYLRMKIYILKKTQEDQVSVMNKLLNDVIKAKG